MCDLDDVVDVVDGWSARKEGWQAFVIYDPKTRRFVELQSTPPDVRGNSADDAEEVSEEYVRDGFQLTEMQIAQLRRAPRNWQFLRRRG